MKKSDLTNCVLDSNFGPDSNVRESLPMRYLISEENGWYHLFETSDMRYFDPAIVRVGLYPMGNDTPASFLEWFING